MDNQACTFALVMAVGSAALGCGAGERFRTAPSSADAGGVSAAAGEAGRAGAAAGAAGTAQAVGSQARAGATQAAGAQAQAGAVGAAGGAVVAGAAPGGAAGSVGQGGASASGAGPIGGAGGSSNTEAAGGSEPPAGSAGAGGVAGAAGTASAGAAGVDDIRTPPDMSEIAAPYAQAVCAAATDCSRELASILFGANDCVSYVTKQVRNAWVPALQVAVAGGTVLYSPDQLDGCLDAVSRLGCRLDAHDYLVECEAAFQGTRTRGQSCSIDAECQGDLYCKIGGACSGTCSDREPVEASCQRDSDCRADLYCGQGELCTERIALNGGCHAEGDQCELGAMCQGADASTNTLGHCEPIGSVFTRNRYSTCDVAQGQLCAWEPTVELSCTFTDEDALCRPRVNSGDTCRLAVPDACPRQEYCQGVSLEDSIFIGECRPLPGEGKPCVSDLGFGKRCAPNHVCLGGACVALRENEADCDSDAECFSGACSAAGVCVPLTACE